MYSMFTITALLTGFLATGECTAKPNASEKLSEANYLKRQGYSSWFSDTCNPLWEGERYKTETIKDTKRGYYECSLCPTEQVKPTLNCRACWRVMCKKCTKLAKLNTTIASYNNTRKSKVCIECESKISIINNEYGTQTPMQKLKIFNDYRFIKIFKLMGLSMSYNIEKSCFVDDSEKVDAWANRWFNNFFKDGKYIIPEKEMDEKIAKFEKALETAKQLPSNLADKCTKVKKARKCDKNKSAKKETLCSKTSKKKLIAQTSYPKQKKKVRFMDPRGKSKRRLIENNRMSC